MFYLSSNGNNFQFPHETIWLEMVTDRWQSDKFFPSRLTSASPLLSFYKRTTLLLSSVYLY